MKKDRFRGWVFLAGILFVSNLALWAQPIQTNQEVKTAITQLDFLVGQWKGTGWIMGMDGQKHNYTQTELVQFKLDSTVILVEGLGKTGEVITHNALAIISYDTEEGTYNFRSYLSTGQGGTFKGELKDGTFIWYPNENMRYVININADKQWFEKGEMKRGENWFQFMEMTLDRAD